MKPIWITEVIYIKDFILLLVFNNDERRTINLESYLNTGLFLSIKNIHIFKRVKLNTWTIEWDNGIDFAPEFLYENSKPFQHP